MYFHGPACVRPGEDQVANVFISHSSDDAGWAADIHQWLTEDGHHVFLDQHQSDGIAAGDDWEQRLYDRLRWADAVICVVTPSYLKSVWCAAEIGAARALGNELLPVLASAERVEDRLLATKQYVDAVHDPDDARSRLRSRLSVIDGAGGRGWRDDMSPYPGLRAFDAGEHRVFFGRTREIKEVTERLRSPSERASRGILTVVGPSGCGKSSLIRAGVIPRLVDGEDWLPLPPIFPGSDPVGNLVRAIASMVRERHIDFDVTSLRTHLQSDGLSAMATDLLVAAETSRHCKLLVVIDQFEELLTQTGPAERAEFVALLARALGGPVQVLATLRPEFLDAASKDADVSTVALQIHQVRPLAADTLRSVIEEPANLAGLSFDDDLVSRLLTDTGSGDALPLLAFTLEQLADGVGRGGRLTHERYAEIGGVRGALARQADAALQDACGETSATREQVITSLLSLVTIDEQGRPTKRTVALDECSDETRAQLQPFVARRLLVTEAAGERTFVSVAHEAFLGNWPPLTHEIEAQVTALRARRVVENAANDWAASARDDGALLQGRQLTRAAVDTGAELQAVDRTWPRRHRLVTRVELNDTGREFLEASMRTDRARRRRRVLSVAAVIAILVATTAVSVAGFRQATIAKQQAQFTAKNAIAARLLNEGAAMLAQTRGGGDVRAFQELLAAHALIGDAAVPGLLDAALKRSTTAKVVDVGVPVVAVAYSPDGHRIATASRDETVRLWDAGTGARVRELTGHTDNVFTVAFSPDGHRLASAGADNTIRFWDADTGEPVGTPLTGHTKGVTGLAFSPDGHRLASSGNDATVRVWDVDSGQSLHVLSGHAGTVRSVAFSPDGHRLASAGFDGTARLWDADSGQPLHTLTGQTSLVLGVAFSPDGRRLVSSGKEGDMGGAIRVWDVVTGQLLQPPIAQPSPVMALAFRPDGRQFATVGNSLVQVWDAATGRPVGAPLTGLTGVATGVAYSPDGHHLATAGFDDKTLRIWDVDANRPSIVTPAGVESVAFSPDGHRMATGGIDQMVQVWNADTGEPLGPPMAGHLGAVSSVAFSPDGHHLASGSYDHSVQLWNADTGLPMGQPLILPDDVKSVAWSPDGDRLATASYDGTVRLWNTHTGHQQIGPSLTGHTDQVLAVAFSPDGHRLASASADRTVRLWNADTGEPIGEPLTGHTNQVLALAFSPDGHRLASASGDNSVRLWNADTGQPIGAPLTGHTDMVLTVAFSPDGHRLASGSADHTVRFWDVDTGQPIGAPLTGHTNWVDSVAFSPSGGLLAAAGLDNSVTIWPTVATPQMLCDKLTVNMSHKQWRDWVSEDPDIGYQTLCPRLPVAPD
jgi:WD40 repeat protein